MGENKVGETRVKNGKKIAETETKKNEMGLTRHKVAEIKRQKRQGNK